MAVRWVRYYVCDALQLPATRQPSHSASQGLKFVGRGRSGERRSSPQTLLAPRQTRQVSSLTAPPVGAQVLDRNKIISYDCCVATVLLVPSAATCFTDVTASGQSSDFVKTSPSVAPQLLYVYWSAHYPASQRSIQTRPPEWRWPPSGPACSLSSSERWGSPWSAPATA